VYSADRSEQRVHGQR